MTSVIDELRRMLDERGVEYFKHEDGEPLRKLEKADEPATSWHMGGASVCAVPIEGSDLFDLWIDHCTPEQAIAATLGDEGVARSNDGVAELGAGTCHETMIDRFFRGCSECGYMWEFMYGIGRCQRPNFCPNCGRKVVDDG